MPSFGGIAPSGLVDHVDTGQMVQGLTETQEALIGLADTFAGFFSDVNLGFQGMIDGVITGIKRLIAELIAKAVWLALLSLLPGGAGIFTMANIIGGNIGSIMKNNATGGGGTGVGNLVPATNGPTSQQLEFKIRGKDLYTSYNRYAEDMS
jgi:hypothetical protein